MSSFQTLIAKVRIRGIMETLTGLHVGGSDVGLKVGGADKVVVKDPKTGRPYIPGSSLKGKMRALLEKAGFCCDGTSLNPNNHGRPGRSDILACHCGTCVVCQLFGVPAEEGRRGGGGQQQHEKEGASTAIRCVGRLIFRDAHLDETCAQSMETWRYLAAPYVEVKTEVSIDRLTSQANPRNFERVPAGARFNFEVVLDVCKDDNKEHYLETIRQGFRLIANDYLGGQGTRGYGAVRLHLNEISQMTLSDSSLGDFEPFEPEGWKLPWVEPPLPQEVDRGATSNGA